MRVGVTVRQRELTAVLVEDGRVAGHTTAPVTRGAGLRVALRRALRRLLPGGAGAVVAVTIDAGRLVDGEVARVGEAPAEVVRAEVVRAGAARVGAARAGVAPVAVLRLARPLGSVCPPLWGWPPLPDSPVATVAGGYDLFGMPLAPLDRAGVRAFGARVAALGTEWVAITAAGAVLAGGHEAQAAELLAAAAPAAAPTLSHELGGLGLAYRENATIANALLRGFADQLAADCQGALRDLRLAGRLGFVLGDGALAAPERWSAYPVLALGSTTAATVTGAGTLTGTADASVVLAEEGGAVAQLAGGWPVTAPRRTLPYGPVVAVPTPAVRRLPDASPPTSVIHVAAGADVTPVLAAAVGAATARPAVTVDRLVLADTPERLDAALAQARDDALARLVTAGADPATAQVRDAHVTALAYLAGTVRVQVRAVGRPAAGGGGE